MEQNQLRKVLEGDINAFRFFVDKYKDMGYAVALGIAKNPDFAEEIMQNAFVKAFQGLNHFRQESKFSTWFYRIVVNEAVVKCRKKDILSDASDVAEIVNINSSELNTALNSIHREEQTKFINEALDKLHPRESLILRLHYLTEHTIQEISEITGMTETNIKVILHRARKSLFTELKKCLKNEIYSLI